MRGLRELTIVLLGCAGACADDAAARTDPNAGASGAIQRVVPDDGRPVTTALRAPPPISGGTLLVTRDLLAVAADPDRDRVSVVDLRTHLAHSLPLEARDEPGRAVEDADGLVHVVLRGAGAVASLSPRDVRLLARRTVCREPRGIDYDAAADELVIACAGGELLRMPAGGGPARGVGTLPIDLRDVLVAGPDLLVTRFRSAELLGLSSAGLPPRIARPETEHLDPRREQSSSPALAYRLRRVEDGSHVLLHQLERDDAIEIDPFGFAPYGASAGSCGGVVQTAIARVDASGRIERATRVPGALAVDVALSAEGRVAVALAGAPPPEQPATSFVLGGMPLGPRLAPTGRTGLLLGFLPDDELGEEPAPCTALGAVGSVEGQITSVAFAPGGQQLVAQSREPAVLYVLDFGEFFAPPLRIDLGGPSVADTGHDLFHLDAGGGIACASCHAEGGDDGHTWSFAELGARRTQSLHVGLAGTAPFHWQGDEPDFTALVQDVMVGRMGGVHLSPERIAALERYVYELTPPTPRRAPDDLAALRGKVRFEHEAGCAECHAGSAFSDGLAHDVGKSGGPLQTPSLVGIGYRSPLMHDGCAHDLRARFTPECGGQRHGRTQGLTAAALEDLIAYLETL